MLRFVIAMFLSMLVGFISLCQEILWFRALTYTTASDPRMFAYTLGFFLFGIALGALFVQRMLKTKVDATIRVYFPRTRGLRCSFLCFDASSRSCLCVVGRTSDLACVFASDAGFILYGRDLSGALRDRHS